MKNTNSRRRPLRRKNSVPLRATISERTGINILTEPEAPPAPQTTMLTPPTKPTRDILALLLACTGFALAAKPEACIELLPGAPTTVLITANNKAQAAFVLPISQEAACKVFGMQAPVPRDRDLEQLWEEDRRHAC